MTSRIGAVRGTALYVAALMGPGVLLVPALAVEAAGPASVLAWIALLALSVPLAVTFAALGIRHPEPGGVTVYVRRGIGDGAAAITGAWFVAAVLMGAPAVALVGGYYVADLLGGGRPVAVGCAVGLLGATLAANAGGVRVAASAQLALSALLVVAIAVAVAVALPEQDGGAWTPFAPHGAVGVATAASLLVWQFVGWEAMAQLAGDFRDPRRSLPRAVCAAFLVVTTLYLGLAVASVGIGGGSRVPLADLVAVGFGDAGRDVTAILALVLTFGTMNVYVGAAARLSGALALEGALPRWLAGGGREVPRRPLLVIAAVAVPLFALLATEVVSAATLVRATSACFVAVYLLALTAATRLLPRGGRTAARAAVVPMAAVAVASGAYLLVPATAAAVVLGVRRSRPRP